MMCMCVRVSCSSDSGYDRSLGSGRRHGVVWWSAYFCRFGDGFAEDFDFDVADGGMECHRHGW